MSKKKIVNQIKENSVLILPSDNKELENFILKNKTYLTEQALSSIEYSVENKLPLAEVFRFNNSDFVVTILEKEYLTNIDHIYKFYLETENYELCSRVVQLQTVLKKINPNEKKIEITGEN